MTGPDRHPQITKIDIATQVETFYQRVRDDPLLGPVFASRIEPDAWPPHLDRMRDFWATILRGEGSYRGNPLLVHRGIPGLAREHFGRWLELFEQVAHERFAAPIATIWVQRAQRMAQTLQSGLPAAPTGT